MVSVSRSSRPLANREGSPDEPESQSGNAPAPESRPAPSSAGASPLDQALAMERAARAATAISAFMNLVGMLAAPRVWANASAWLSREHLLENIDTYLAVADQSGWRDSKGQPAFQGTTGPVQHLRAVAATWEPGHAVPPEVSNAARAVLAALGLPEPPEGWDRFEG